MVLYRSIVTQQANSNGACTICLKRPKAGQQMGVTNCDHKFHIKCFNKWFDDNDNCPVCRFDCTKTRKEYRDEMITREVTRQVNVYKKESKFDELKKEVDDLKKSASKKNSTICRLEKNLLNEKLGIRLFGIGALVISIIIGVILFLK